MTVIFDLPPREHEKKLLMGGTKEQKADVVNRRLDYLRARLVTSSFGAGVPDYMTQEIFDMVIKAHE